MPNIIISYSVNLNINPNTQQSHTEAHVQAVPDPKLRSIGKFTVAQNIPSEDNEETLKETGKDDVLDSTEIRVYIIHH